MKPFHFVTVVWGEPYTALYLKSVLPTQLSPGNLPALAKTGSSYKVYTTQEDANVIRSSPAFQSISTYMSAELIEFAQDAKDLSFDHMIENHCLALKEANEVDAVFIALSPDAIFSDGSFATLASLHAKGIRLVFVPSIRTQKETIIPALDTLYAKTAGVAKTITPRTLVSLILKHLHPISKSLYWDSEEFNVHPSHLYWEIGDTDNKALLAHCFHMHPVLMDPVDKKIVPMGSIDADYIDTVCPNSRSHYIIKDSDELACIEISGEHHQIGNHGTNTANIQYVAQWANDHCTYSHLELSKIPLLLHTGSTTRFDKEKKQTSEIIASILKERKIVGRKARREVQYPFLYNWTGLFKELNFSGFNLRCRKVKEPNDDTQRKWSILSLLSSDIITVTGINPNPKAIEIICQIHSEPETRIELPSGQFKIQIGVRKTHYRSAFKIKTQNGNLEKHNIHIAELRVWRGMIHRHNRVLKDKKLPSPWITIHSPKHPLCFQLSTPWLYKHINIITDGSRTHKPYTLKIKNGDSIMEYDIKQEIQTHTLPINKDSLLPFEISEIPDLRIVEIKCIINSSYLPFYHIIRTINWLIKPFISG